MTSRILILVSLTLLSSCSKSKEDVDLGDCIPFSFSDTYKYPIRPGSDQWTQLMSSNEMFEVTQIPETTLTSISTEGLLETLLTHPMIGNYIFYQYLQDGFSNTIERANGFEELYNRPDIYDVITERYALMSLDCDIYPPGVGTEAHETSFSFLIYESFIFQNDFFDELSTDKQLEIFELIHDKLQLKNEHGYGSFSKLVSIAILGKIMIEVDYRPFLDVYLAKDFLQLFIERIPTFRPVDLEPTDIIEEYAVQFRTEFIG